VAKIDTGLLRKLQQLKEENQSLQGQVNVLKGQSNQGGLRQNLGRTMKGIFGGLRNPRLGSSKISPLPARFRGRRLF